VRLDNDLDYLLTKVKNELDGDLNIIILSDHVFNKENIEKKNIRNLFLF